MIAQDIAETIIDPKAYADFNRIEDAFRTLRARRRWIRPTQRASTRSGWSRGRPTSARWS